MPRRSSTVQSQRATPDPEPLQLDSIWHVAHEAVYNEPQSLCIDSGRLQEVIRTVYTELREYRLPKEIAPYLARAVLAYIRTQRF